MIKFIYLIVAINFLLVESSSLRNKSNRQNEFVEISSSKGDLTNENGSKVKIISREPFIMQLATQQGIEKFKNDKEKEKKEKTKKKLFKKRYHKLKALKKKERTKREADFTEKIKKEVNNLGKRKENQRRIYTDSKNLQKPVWETHNMNLAPKLKRREIDSSKESFTVEDKNDKKLFRSRLRHKLGVKPKNLQRLSHHTPSSYTTEIPLSAIMYPPNAKSDKDYVKYTEKELQQDLERVEEKTNFVKRMLKINDSDSSAEVNKKSRKTDSDKAAHKIAKMFLALSALNHNKLRSKLKSEEDSKNWESEEEEDEDEDDNSIKSFNEERYKIKKWIEHMKSKRSSKTCNCNDEGKEDYEFFPLEKTLETENSQDSLEDCKKKIAGTKNSSLRRKFERLEKPKNKNCIHENDFDNKIKALTTRGRRKLELPLDDLEAYRARAKQILQNAEEILDKLNKQEEEKRYSNPVSLMNHLKELTSRIHVDPRNSENDLIRMIQKNVDWSSLFKFRDEDEKKDFSKSLKSYFVDPYEKARALTEESARKLSAYLLKNLAMLSNEEKKEKEESVIVEKKEEAPQIYQTQNSLGEDLFSVSDLKSRKNDEELSKEREILQPKLDSNEPTYPTTFQHASDERNLKDSIDVLRLGPGPFHKKYVKLQQTHQNQPKEAVENPEELKDNDTLTAKNPEDIESALDWKSSDLNDNKSEILQQNNVNEPNDYEINKKNIEFGATNFSENQETTLENKNEDQISTTSSSNKNILNLLQEKQTERNTMLEKNKKLLAKDSTKMEPQVTFLNQKSDLNNLEFLLKPKTEFKDDKSKTEVEQKPAVTEEKTGLVEKKIEWNSKNVEPISEDENRTENTLKQFENRNDLPYSQEKSATIEEKHKIHELNSKKESSKEVKKLEGISEERDNLRMNKNKLDEGNEDTISEETDKNITKVNLENVLDSISEQQTNKNFSSEKLFDQIPEEKLNKDNSKESPEVLKKEHKKEEKDLEDVALKNIDIVKEKIEKDNMSEEAISEELKRNENDVLASEYLQPQKEQEMKQQSKEQNSALKKDEKKILATTETEDLVNNYLEKDISSVQNSKEKESESNEELGNGKEDNELLGALEENAETEGDSKFISDTITRQGYNSFSQDNSSAEYPISQNFQGLQSGSEDPVSSNAESEEKILGSQERETGSTESQKELLGSQEKSSSSTEREEELLGSKDSTKPEEELLGSREKGASSTNSRENLDSREKGEDSREPDKELLGSEEKRTISTESKDILQQTGGFSTLEPENFRSRESVQEKQDWVTGFKSIESEAYENKDTSQEGKDWIIESDQQKTEDILQSENQKKDAKSSESEEREEMGISSEREDISVARKLEEEIPEQQNQMDEVNKTNEKPEEATLGHESDQKVLKETQNVKKIETEEIQDNQSSNVDESSAKERTNDDNVSTTTEIEKDDDKEQKLLRKIDEEEKEIILERDNLMKKMLEGDNKKWATHPFEDEISKDFKEVLPGLEYYEKEDPQTSQFSGKALEYGEPFEEENLQETNITPKTKNLKIPQEIEKIMKDLNEGQEKDDIQSIQNLDPDKIDKFIDKIDEAKKEEEKEDVDCKKECACADKIELRSRRTGRYEIAKDFLRWLKDMKLNRVLSDD